MPKRKYTQLTKHTNMRAIKKHTHKNLIVSVWAFNCESFGGYHTQIHSISICLCSLASCFFRSPSLYISFQIMIMTIVKKTTMFTNTNELNCTVSALSSLSLTHSILLSIWFSFILRMPNGFLDDECVNQSLMSLTYWESLFSLQRRRWLHIGQLLRFELEKKITETNIVFSNSFGKLAGFMCNKIANLK